MENEGMDVAAELKNMVTKWDFTPAQVASGEVELTYARFLADLGREIDSWLDEGYADRLRMTREERHRTFFLIALAVCLTEPTVRGYETFRSIFGCLDRDFYLDYKRALLPFTQMLGPVLAREALGDTAEDQLEARRAARLREVHVEYSGMKNARAALGGGTESAVIDEPTSTSS